MDIARLNDEFRSTFIGGKVVITSGIQALDDDIKRLIFAAVMGFNAFNKDNDPHGERDFGSFKVSSSKKSVVHIFWKIDYFDVNYEFGSENPADPTITRRVLTIMLAGEY
jgi:Protein of unknown function (DUF3768)